MFKGVINRSYSALSKRTNRVRVQILKDFPQFQLYKGQVTKVTPSLMRNYLHHGNGACYILQDSDINEELQLSAAEKAAKKPVVVKQVSKQVKISLTSEVKDKESEPRDESGKVKKDEPVFSSGVSLKDVKIPGLEI